MVLLSLPYSMGELFILLFFMGIAVGGVAATFGFVGGFLTTPLLVLVGVPPVFAVMSSVNKILSCSLLGLLRNYLNGNIGHIPAGWLWAGSIPGSATGVLLMNYLVQAGSFEIVFKVSYIIILSLVGSWVLLRSLNSYVMREKEKINKESKLWPKVCEYCQKYLLLEHNSTFTSLPAWPAIVLSFMAGIASGLFGIGGSILLLPVLMYFFRVSPPVASGLCLVLVFATSLTATLGHVTISQSFNFYLGLILFAGWITGASLSTYIIKKLTPSALRLVLSVIMIFTVSLFAFDK